MRIFRVQFEQWLPQPIDTVFAFFSDAGNLERITPPWLSFRNAGQVAGPIREGRVLEHRLRIHGIPVRWRSQITEWEPPHRFVDRQQKGPYRLWVHEHSFEPKDGGTQVTDVVRYAVWGGALVNRWMVAGDLEKIFSYRRQRLQEIFGAGHLKARQAT